MKKSEEIKERIYLLEKALEVALEEEREKKYLWKDGDGKIGGRWDKKIGFWNISRIELFLGALNEGHTLRMFHGSYGVWDVKMNPQKNRILVDYSGYSGGGPSEDNILRFVGFNPTSCYILEYGN